MGGKRLRNWVKGLGTNFIESRDAVPSTQSLSLPTGSEQRDLQHGTEPSGRTSEPHASTAEPVGDDQAAPAGTDAGVQAARPPAAAQRAPPPDLAIEPRAEASPATQLPQRQTHSISTSQRLWNAAYDRLKDDKDTAELVTAYVKTLMKVLGASLETTFGADVMTELEDPVRRQLVMKKLVEEGRSKADKASKIAKRVGDFAQAVLSFKPLVDLVMSIPQAAPAALPWAGVCIGLQILSNPAAAAKSNLAGITHVLSRMEWYDAVTEHLLNEDGLEIRDGTFQAVLRQLEEKVVALYKALLLYQMKSICSYYRHQGYVFLRALANWDDWDAHLKTITDAEDTLRRDSSQYNKQHASSALGELVGRAEGTQNLLGNIRQDIRELIALQKKAQSDKDTKCLQALFVVNPQDHMARIEDEKDKLLYEVYEWMLHTESYAAFTSWDQPDLPLCRLLWIKGTAGTGKTMLMMGIIRELLDQSAALAPSLSYFFCQGTGTKKLNSATAALKSLLWMLLIQQPHLISYLQDDYKYSGGFADETEFYTLQRIFEDILRDPSLSEAYLIVDALDEFDRTKPGLEELIRLISTSLVLSKKVKWLLSSRPEVDLLARVTDRNADTLDTSETLVELDTERLEKPVHAYIGHKLSTLKGKRGYDDSILGEVETEVRQRAMNTFLWVALAFKVLEKAHGQQAVQRIQKIPPGLSELYGHMMDRIDQVEEISPQDCKKVLLCAGLAFRPLAFAELAILADMPVDITETAVELCGSFLATREKTVFLIHQSAKEYLAQKWLQVTEIAQGHANIGRRSIEAMSSALKRNIYGLDYGLKPMGMKAPQPDPLAPIQYACVFWADHLAFESGKSPECQESLADDGEVLLFLEEYILHWLESLSLLGNLSEGIQSVKRLLQIAQISGTSRRLAKFLEDADKFIRSHGSIMERAPMQIYCSALAFSPTTSEVKKVQWKHRLPFIQKIAGIRTDWDAHRQTLEGHSEGVWAVAFSRDGKTLASASEDETIRLWDAATGTLRQTLEGHDRGVVAIAFSCDGKTLASVSSDMTIRLWDAATEIYRQTLEGHGGGVEVIAFSRDGKMLASLSNDRTIRLWDAATGTHRQTLEGHSDRVAVITFSHDGKTLASASDDETIRLWDATTGTHWQTLEGYNDGVMAIAFSRDGKTLASSLVDNTVRLWDVATGTHWQTLEGHGEGVMAIAFSYDGKTLASADTNIRLWDVATGTLRQTLEGHGNWVMAIAFSRDGKTLASASLDMTIRLWDVATEVYRQTLVSASSDSTVRLRDTAPGTHLPQTLRGYRDGVTAIAFSRDGKTLASALSDSTVQLWDAATGTHRQTLEGHSNGVTIVAFSRDSKTLVSASDDKTARLWDADMGTHRQTLEGHESRVTSVAFSRDGKTLASASDDDTVRLWDVATGTHRQTLKGHRAWVKAVAFSRDGKTVASASLDKTVRLWDAATGTLRQTLAGYDGGVMAIAFSRNGKTLASGSSDNTIRLWDVATGTHWQTLEGHSGWVMAVAFSRDGKTLASASEDRTIRLWDAATGTHRQTLEGHGSGSFKAIAFSRDGRFLETNYGLLRLSSTSASPDQHPDKRPSDHALSVDDEWITADTKGCLWLPKDYRPTVVALDGNRIALGHESGRMTFLELKFAQ